MIKVIRSVAFVAMLPSLAAAQADIARQRRDPIEVFTNSRHGSVRLDSVAYWEEVSAPLATTFDAVVRVIKHHSKLRVEQVDTIAKVVYNKRLITSGRLAGKPMSRWLRCGTGLTAGDYADQWRLTLAYAVFADSVSATASKVGVALYATARNTEGVSTGAVVCASTGALEKEIVTKVREVVQGL